MASLRHSVRSSKRFRTDDHVDRPYIGSVSLEGLDRIFEELDEVQEKMDELAREREREIDKADMRDFLRRRPLYIARSLIIRTVNFFWLKAFLGHPVISEYLLPPDQEVFKYLTDAFVDELHDNDATLNKSGGHVINMHKDGNSNGTHGTNEGGVNGESGSVIGFRVTFYFKDNPYFSNSILFKEFRDNDDVEDGPPTISQSTIQWKEGMNYMDSIRPPKKPPHATSNGTKHNGHDSVKKHEESSDDSEEEDSEEDEEEDSSFFTWFDAKNKDKELGEKIIGEFWRDPVQYFQEYKAEQENANKSITTDNITHTGGDENS